MPEERGQPAGGLARFNLARLAAIEDATGGHIQPLPGPCPAHRAALLYIAALRQLDANWDSYGSPAIGAEALQSATLVLQLIDALQPGNAYVAPVSGGGVQLSWRRGEIALNQDVLRALVRWLLDQ